MVSRRTVLSLAAAFVCSAVLWAAGHPAQGAAFTVSVGTATVAGRADTILVDANGFALYYLTSDRATATSCTEACAGAWPPLLSAAPPTGPSSLPGRLTTVTTAHGAQASYNGHLLYRYAGDSQPGQVNGHDRGGPGGGKWFVATPRLSAATGAPPTDSGGTPTGGDRGY
jgi:predicted lipoprotein with Yx(FWY)xxD motif